ncbi:type II secretion system F family protein [Stomatohabitans albus]|uniref:type II secretion system F family protein n=1 Tax=Stomatohabitans albus TaxID=3110766 RepID=UPI00300C8E37
MVTHPTPLTMSDVVMIRAALSTGVGPVIAMIRAASYSTHGTALRVIAARLASGQTLTDVASQFVDADTTGRLLRVLAMADQCGTAAGPVVDEVIHGIRRSARMAASVRAKQAEANVTAAILIALPCVGLTMAILSGEAARTFLMSSWGIGVLAIAIGMMLLAGLWMRYLVRGVQRAARSVDPLVTRNGKQADPSAELTDLLALALGSGVAPEQAFLFVSQLIGEPQASVCLQAARSWHVADDPLEVMPDALSDIGRILIASTAWGAPVVTTLHMHAEDLRMRANEEALEAAEGLSARLVLPTTLLLMPAFMLVMVVPVLVPAITSVIHR